MTDKTAESASVSSRFQPARLAAWASLAILSAISANYLYQHPIQITRTEAVAVADPAKQIQQAAQQQAAATKDVLIEIKRLSAAVGSLNADRDKLYSRVGSLEQNLDSVTGSLSRQPTPGANAAPVPAPPAPVPPEQGVAGVSASSETSTPAGTASADSAASKAAFGVDLGAGSNLDGLRAMWRKEVLASPILAGLQPMIALRENSATSSFNLRLIAGPLSDAAAAARLCATLKAGAQRPCEPSAYEGQRLAMDVAPPASAPRKKPAPLRLPSAARPAPVAPQILPR